MIFVDPLCRPLLTGIFAIDAARLTGLPIYCRPRLDGQDDPVHPDAAEDACERGVWQWRDVVLDRTRLDWWDKLKLTLALLGAEYYMDTEEQREAA